MPSPTSARACASTRGWSTGSDAARPLVITTSGRIVVVRSRSTAAPHWWHCVYGPAVGPYHSMAEVQAQLPCSSVTSFQCWSSAIAFRAGNQFPAMESPTRATVSRGCAVSPKTHGFGVSARGSARQPSLQ